MGVSVGVSVRVCVMRGWVGVVCVREYVVFVWYMWYVCGCELVCGMCAHVCVGGCGVCAWLCGVCVVLVALAWVCARVWCVHVVCGWMWVYVRAYVVFVWYMWYVWVCAHV